MAFVKKRDRRVQAYVVSTYTCSRLSLNKESVRSEINHIAKWVFWFAEEVRGTGRGDQADGSRETEKGQGGQMEVCHLLKLLT